MTKPAFPEKSRLHTVLSLVARLLVGGVLVYAGFSKATQPAAEFAAALNAYQVLPASWLGAVASIFPWFELYAGVFILFGFMRRPASYAAALFFAVFLMVFGLSFIRGIDIASCGCFGSGLSLPLSVAFTFDVILLALSSFLLMKPSDFLTADGWIKRGS